MYTSAHHGVIHNSQKAGTTECLLNGLAKRGVSVQWDVLWQLNGLLLPMTTRVNLGNIERSSHGGAHTLVFPCQLGARPRASGVPHAAFITGSPRGRIPSVGILANSLCHFGQILSKGTSVAKWFLTLVCTLLYQNCLGAISRITGSLAPPAEILIGLAWGMKWSHVVCSKVWE